MKPHRCTLEKHRGILFSVPFVSRNFLSSSCACLHEFRLCYSWSPHDLVLFSLLSVGRQWRRRAWSVDDCSDNHIRISVHYHNHTHHQGTLRNAHPLTHRPTEVFFSIMWILVFHKAPLCVCCRCWRVAYQKPGLRNVSSLLATVTSTTMRSVSQSVILICTSGFWMMARFILGCVKGSLSFYINPRCTFFTLFSKWKPLDTL